VLCTKCGTDLPDDSRSCPSCRQTLGVVSVGGGAAAAVAPARIPAPETKSSNAIWSVVGIVLLLALICASWYVREKTLSSLPQSQAEQVSQPE
jgi:hypothetical protein